MMKCPKCGFELEDDEIEEDYILTGFRYMASKEWSTNPDPGFNKELSFIGSVLVMYRTIESRPFDLVEIPWSIPNVNT